VIEVTFIDSANRLESTLSEATDNIHQVLVDRHTALEATSGDMVARIKDAGDQTSTRLEETTGKLESVVSEQNTVLETIGDSLVGKIAQVNSNTSSKLGETADKLETILSVQNDALATTGVQIASRLADASQAINQIVDEKTAELISSGDQIAARLNATTMGLAERLKSENETMVDAVTARASEGVEALSNTNQRLRAEVGDLLTKLAQSNDVLSSLISGAGHNLTGIQDALGEQTASFQNAVTRAAEDLQLSNRVIEGNYTNLKDVSSSILGQVSAIANRFEDQARSLSDVTTLIDATQNNLANNIDERGEALEEMTRGLVSRSSELEKLMDSFTRIVGDSVSLAENRARDLGSNLADSVSAAATEATERFTEATRAMSEAANSVRRELASTRHELQKGVNDLPEETKESTAAMRRVVSDQIKALRDLTDLVARTEKSIDATPARERAYSSAAPSQSPAYQSAMAAPAQVAAAAEPAIATEPAPSQLRGSLNFEQGNPAPENKGDGWVSDLLRRASREEEEPALAPRVPRPDTRTPGHMVESLNSLSVDIAKAIDHEASVELWARYQRGERDVFTRRLYTLKGQQTFENIKSKYAREPEFKKSVDRYITDFERLITDVSKNSTDKSTAQKYLTSDTGKVYTMLAHASGRFDR